MDRQFFIASAQAMERSMYCIARSYLRCEADCEDALQNALLRAWEKRNTLREERYFRTWLTRILINSCKETLRRQKREAPTADFPEAAAPQNRTSAAARISVRAVSLRGARRVSTQWFSVLCIQAEKLAGVSPRARSILL